MNDSKQENVGNEARHRFVLQEPQGRLMWMDDIPVVDTPVSLLDDAGNELATSETDDEGYFDFKGYAADVAEVRCIDADDDATHVIYIEVRRRDTGEAVSETEVSYTEYGDPMYAQTDAEGVVKIEELTDDFYWLEIDGETVEVPTVPAAEVSADEEPRRVWLGSDPGICADDDDVHNAGDDDDGEELDWDDEDLEEDDDDLDE